MRLALVFLCLSLLSLVVGVSLVIAFMARYVVPSFQQQRQFQIRCVITDILVTDSPEACDENSPDTGSRALCSSICVVVRLQYVKVRDSTSYSANRNDEAETGNTPTSKPAVQLRDAYLVASPEDVASLGLTGLNNGNISRDKVSNIT